MSLAKFRICRVRFFSHLCGRKHSTMQTCEPHFTPDVPPGLDLKKERILLHCCCAPCSTAIIEWMAGSGLRPGIFFSNSNIVPLAEYEHRRAEIVRYAAACGFEVIEDEYDHAAWLDSVRSGCRATLPDPARSGCRTALPDPLRSSCRTALPFGPASSECQEVDLDSIPERGVRCLECFRFRLFRAASYAVGNGYSVLTTTLASSRWKDLKQVDEAGLWACDRASSGGGTAPGPSDETVPGSGGGTARGPADGTVLDSGAVPGPFRLPGCLAAPAPGSGKVTWWGQNWRLGGLQDRRVVLIRENGLYNQNYCGCEFSFRH